MNWTNEIPTKAGKYWWRPTTKVGGTIVNVYETKLIGLYVLAIIDGMTWTLTVGQLSGEWTERLSEPISSSQKPK